MSEPALRAYHLLPGVRGDLLAKLGRLDEARDEFERAAALTRNVPERALLVERAAARARGTAPPRRHHAVRAAHPNAVLVLTPC